MIKTKATAVAAAAACQRRRKCGGSRPQLGCGGSMAAEAATAWQWHGGSSGSTAMAAAYSDNAFMEMANTSFT